MNFWQQLSNMPFFFFKASDIEEHIMGGNIVNTTWKFSTSYSAFANWTSQCFWSCLSRELGPKRDATKPSSKSAVHAWVVRIFGWLCWTEETAQPVRTFISCRCGKIVPHPTYTHARPLPPVWSSCREVTLFPRECQIRATALLRIGWDSPQLCHQLTRELIHPLISFDVPTEVWPSPLIQSNYRHGTGLGQRRG